MLDMGAVERNIAKQAMRFGEKLPERIAKAPSLKNGLQIYLQAFFDLDTERSNAVVLTPIPWSAINAYAKAYDFDCEQEELLMFFIRKIDNAYLERLEKKQPKIRKK